MMGMTKADKWLLDKFEKYNFEILLGVLLILSLGLRVYFTPFTEYSSDYTGCLYPWWEEYRQYGVVGGLARTIGNYYVPYNLVLAFASLFPIQPCYIISAFSVLADYTMAFYIYKILTSEGVRAHVLERKAKLIAVLSLYIPCVLTNGSLWKQCDSVYTALIVISIYYLISEKYTKSLVFFSLSFVFKLQAVFMLPIYFMMYISKKKFSLLNFFVIPVVFFIAGLPAIICGRSIGETYGVYFGQTEAGKSMMTNTVNIYEFCFPNPEVGVKPALIFTFTVVVLFMWLFYNAKVSDNRLVLMMAAWIPWTCFMFLPRMRQRYDFIALVFFTVYVLAFEKKAIWSVILVNIISAMGYSVFLFKVEYSIMGRTIPYVCVYMLFTLYVLYKLTGKKNA